jgi:hypothetical protein
MSLHPGYYTCDEPLTPMHEQTQRKSRNISWLDKEIHGYRWKRGFPGLRTKASKGIQGLADKVRFIQHDFDFRIDSLLLMAHALFK